MDLPGFLCHVAVSYVPSKAAWTKKRFLVVRICFPLTEMRFSRFSRGTAGSAGTAGLRKRLVIKRPTVFALRKRITRLKLSILQSGQSTFTLKRVASSGPMAPCRSHDRYYTRQNWIFEEIHQELSPVTCKLIMRTKILDAGTSGWSDHSSTEMP